MTSPNPQPSLTEALLVEMTQQMQKRQSEQLRMQAEQMQRLHVEQSRELEIRLSEIVVSQQVANQQHSFVMTSIMNRLERVEATRLEGMNPDLWTARPEVSSYCDLAPFTRAPLSLSSPSYSQPPSFVHHYQIETVAPLRRSLRRRDKARADYRRMERPEFPERLPLMRGEGTAD